METLDPEAGAILLVDKPLTWTSFNVVAKLRGALHKLCGHRVKVGHAGTLDPLATGLLILGTGRMTKLLPGLTEPQLRGQLEQHFAQPVEDLDSAQLTEFTAIVKGRAA